MHKNKSTSNYMSSKLRRRECSVSAWNLIDSLFSAGEDAICACKLSKPEFAAEETGGKEIVFYLASAAV